MKQVLTFDKLAHGSVTKPDTSSVCQVKDGWQVCFRFNNGAEAYVPLDVFATEAEARLYAEQGQADGVYLP